MVWAVRGPTAMRGAESYKGWMEIGSHSCSICAVKKRTCHAISSMQWISPMKERWKGFTSGLSCGVESLGERKRGHVKRTYVLEFDISQFTKFGHSVVSDLGWYKELDEAHGLRA